MSRSHDHIRHLQQLLELEKRGTMERFREQSEGNTLGQRVKAGMSWYPLQVVETGFGLGEYPFLILESTKEEMVPPSLNSGKAIRVFRPDQEDVPPIQGSIQWSDRKRLKVIFQADDLPDHWDRGKWALDLLFDETTFREMEIALKKSLDAENDRLEHLRERLIFEKKPSDFDPDPHFQDAGLNDSQNKAVQMALASPELGLIHGPPGTGKTTTLVSLIKELAQREKQVLVGAPSNAATDLLVERLSAAGLNVVRVGNLSRIDESVTERTLDARIASHPDYKTIKKTKRKAEEFRNLARKYKRNFGPEERAQRKAMYQEARDLANEARDREADLVERILGEAQVVCSTLVGFTHRFLRKRHFKTVVVDEASQALEPATWIALTKADRAIIAGDPHQLPPTVIDPEAAKKGLDVTLMQRCLEHWPATALLNTQYRMEPEILGFSNQQFYDGQLTSGENIATRTQSEWLTPHLEFVDTAGCGFEEERHPENPSLFNSGEADILIKHLQELMTITESEGPYTIGVVSPYRGQVNLLEDRLREQGGLPDYLSINTIDSFQGQERDIIYLSLVRANEKGEIGFLGDYRRMNVALTRAKRKLVVIGDSATIGVPEFYQRFLAYTEEVGGYRSAWEWM